MQKLLLSAMFLVAVASPALAQRKDVRNEKTVDNGPTYGQVVQYLCQNYVFPSGVSYKNFGVHRDGNVNVTRLDKDGNSYWITAKAKYELSFGMIDVGHEECRLEYDNGNVTVSWGGRELISTESIADWVKKTLVPNVEDVGRRTEEEAARTGAAHLYSVPARVNAPSRQYRASKYLGQPPLAMTQDGRLFTIEAGWLWKIDLNDDGRAKQLKGSTWLGDVALTAVGNELYAVEAERLWSINPNTGDAKALLGDENRPTFWRGRVSLAGYKDGDETQLFAIESHSLWKIDVRNGVPTHLKGRDSDPAIRWEDGAQLAFADGNLYAIENRRLHLINTDNGHIVATRPGTYSPDVTVGADAENIYVVDKNNLWKIKPSDGHQTDLMVRFKGQPLLTARAGVVYAIELD